MVTLIVDRRMGTMKYLGAFENGQIVGAPRMCHSFSDVELGLAFHEPLRPGCTFSTFITVKAPLQRKNVVDNSVHMSWEINT